MLPEFQRAVALMESPKALKNELIAKVEQDCQQRKREIEKSYEASMFILEALREERDTEPYLIAKAFLKLYRRRFKAEYDEQVRMLNALRREVREEANRSKEPDEDTAAADIMTTDLTIADP